MKQCYCLVEILFISHVAFDVCSVFQFLSSDIFQNANDTRCGRFAQHIFSFYSAFKRVPTLYISGFHPSVLLYHRRAWPTFHVPQSLTVTAIMVRNFTSSQHIWKISAPPILPSCEFYSFFVLYILFFCFCVFFWLLFFWMKMILMVVVVLDEEEGLLWSILFHQFGLNWTFIGYYAESSALVKYFQ